jgi:hypothetical protein
MAPRHGLEVLMEGVEHLLLARFIHREIAVEHDGPFALAGGESSADGAGRGGERQKSQPGSSIQGLVSFQ